MHFWLQVCKSWAVIGPSKANTKLRSTKEKTVAGCSLSSSSQNGSLDIDPYLAEFGGADGKVKCLKCGSLFATVGTARRHYRAIHLVSKPMFSCPICTTHFSRKDNLERHLVRTHNYVNSKKWNGICVVQVQVESKCIDTLILGRYFFTASPNGNGGRVRCSQCPKSYAQTASVIRHFKEIHLSGPETRYVCKHCGQVHKRARYFREHLKKAHAYNQLMLENEGIPRLWVV